ncbi:MAG: nucleoside phosphorylase [Bacteroidales bacterium]|nr:nucleoside phosphorylase [Bacteroidales bacterium]
MSNNSLKSSELVLAPNGSLYHINMTGDTLADNVFLVGDPDRVNMFKKIFDKVEFESQNRELHALTGTYHGNRYTALSTGMGCDNIDIVVTELDAAANINLNERTINPVHRSLNLIRIGTSGSLHSDIPCGTLLASAYAIGLDGLLNYYSHDDNQFEEEMTQAFTKHMLFNERLARPYCVKASESLLEKVAPFTKKGITATAPGFYAPQGRHIRIAPSIPDLNEKLASFLWDGLKVTNLEMECSAIYGLSKIMGHNALTVCLIIANRADGTFLNDYHDKMFDTITKIMDAITVKG